uniref:Myosin motor domain-containing protein n=1 Tax=Globisporangium ultimum (strain ATCC 200006 / CBS 805.95 / DAOM BR144) TaxID=431595 RepID=K3WUY7_GLOUD
MADEEEQQQVPGLAEGSGSVWVPHDQLVWKRAVVLRKLDDGKSAEVRLEPNNENEYHKDDGLVKVVNIQEISRQAGELSDQAMPICNTFTSAGVDDMCTLNHLHEPAVLRNLELRFAQKMPYTYTGQICIAVNPYQWLDLYGTHLYRQYLEQPRESLDPHPFALSATSYTDMKRPSKTEIDRMMIVEQLRCAGVIAAIRISRAAFPNRLPLSDFQSRFQIICPSSLRNASPVDMVVGLLKELLPEAAVNTKNSKFAVGKTKVYFSSGLLQKLEDRRNAILKDHALKIQKTVRGYVLRKRFVQLRAATIKIQAFSRGGFQKMRFRKFRAGVIRMQARHRGRKQRVVFAELVIKVRRERQLALERERQAQRERERESEKQRERESEQQRVLLQEQKRERELEAERLRKKELEAATIMSEERLMDPAEDDWSDEEPISPRTRQSLTEAASRVAEAESSARDAKEAAESALELNQELVAQNDRLRAMLALNVAEYADAELLRENERLKQQVLQLQTKLVRSQEVSLISANVVDSRITYREGRQFVEYKLQIETNTRGTLYVWHRYSTFRNLAATLQTKNGYKRKEIPELPNKQLFGNFSEKIIQERVTKLNQFLEAATNAEYLQWGIRVDQDTLVYKRRTKSASSPSRDTTSSSASTTNSSPRASFSIKAFGFRRGSTATN